MADEFEYSISMLEGGSKDNAITRQTITEIVIDPADLERSKKYPMVIDFLSKPISKEMLEYLKEKI